MTRARTARGRRAIVVGSDGQDGRLLFDALRREGWSVLGLEPRGVKTHRAAALGGPVNLGDRRAIERLVARFKPDEIYYLAAYNQPAEVRLPDPVEQFERSLPVHVLGPLHFLEAIRTRSPRTRFFYASSCRVFGHPRRRQDESTPIDPDDVYGITKAGGLFVCRMYRRRWNVFATAGILYNHESPLRAPRYVSRRIVSGLLDVKRGRSRRLVLGDLKARCDWGYAPEFVDAMRRLLAHDRPGDFVIATGRSRTVLDFAKAAARELGLDWRRCVAEDRSLLPEPSSAWAGNPAKLQHATGWRPRTGLREMIRILIGAEAMPVARRPSKQLKSR